MPGFELYDTVVLKSDRTFIGTVERTGNSPETFEILEDRLIIAHVPVPPNILTEFVTTGTPPRGYVFVQFAYEENGSSLVSEEDIILLGRSLDIGEYVKDDEHTSSGVVVSVQESYSLEPICILKPGEQLHRECFSQLAPPEPCGPACPPQETYPDVTYLRPHTLIHNVPGEELRRAQDVEEGDTVIYKDWLGSVDDIETDIIVALEDGSVVVVDEVYDLHVPIPDFDKPLVSMPEFDNVVRPDFLVSLQGYGTTMPKENLQPGTFIVTSRSKLRRGRWLKGEYNPTAAPQGIVLDVITRKIGVTWLTCNPFSVRKASEMHPPPRNLSIYENIRTYTAGDELVRKRDIVVYDPCKQPRSSVTYSMAGYGKNFKDVEAASQHLQRQSRPSGPSQDLQVGRHVRFRDMTAAALKYQKDHHASHGQLIRTPSSATFGWDLNEYKVVAISQTATVLWQDGSTVTYKSTDLKKFATFESELAPADIVLNRAGMKQRPSKKEKGVWQPITDFNEMKIFEQPHNLLPEKVGIVQSVNPVDRVARVRWYQKPNIQIVEVGTMLSPTSRFGPIGDVIEDVSLYEIMSFPALTRNLTDVVVIPPDSNAKQLLDTVRTSEASSKDTKHIPNVGTPYQTSGHLAMLSMAKSRNTGQDLDDGEIKHNDKSTVNGNDWLGEIVALGLDGSITVRLCGLETCRDAIIGNDEIIAIIDDNEYADEFATDDVMDLDSIMTYDDNDYDPFTPIAESFEYEGGERMDNDSGDDNWSTDAEDNNDVEMTDYTVMNNESNTAIDEQLVVTPKDGSRPVNIKDFMPTEPPSVFEVSDTEPPADQFRRDSIPTNNSAFLKRIMKEQRILSSSLPEGEIYVRTYESRLDLLRCLIIGPRDTPYEDCPFMVDLHLGPHFPHEPPTAHFHSWTSGLGRINPNLYEEGKICLSLLGTWPGKNEGEGWSENATVLQVLISLQGLILVRNPFFNEAGFEGFENEKIYALESLQYSEKAFVIARGFVKHALLRPPSGLEDVLAWLYLDRPTNQIPSAVDHREVGSLLSRIIDRGNTLIERSESLHRLGTNQAQHESGGNDNSNTILMNGRGEEGTVTNDTTVFLKPLSKGAVIMLRRTFKELEDKILRRSALDEIS